MKASRILAVDDNKENLYLLGALLRGHGHEVDEAGNGAEALEKALKSPPQLVISDLLMPVMDGYTFLRHWKADKTLCGIPFIVYTATYTDPRDEKLALDLGADAFIVKPSEPDVFMGRINEVLAKQENGSLLPANPPTVCEHDLVKQYNESLVRKLEQKALQLEESNLALLRDVAERKRADEALQASRDLLRSVVENAPIRVFWKDAESRYLGCNSVFASDAGMSRPEDLIGKDDFQLGWRAQAQLYRDDDIKVMTSGLPKLNFEEPQTTPDGHRIWLRTSKVPLRDAEGRILGLLGIYDDITEHKRKETEHEKLQSQLIQAQKMESVGRLAGGVAHDFNNLLSIILGNAELAINKTEPNDPRRENFEEIIKATEHSAGIIKKLLAFARKQIIKPKTIDLNDTVESMLKMLRRLIGEDIDLAWKPGPGLWPVRMDPSQIDQILANLCVNARDAIDSVGRITIETVNVNLDENYCAEREGFARGDFVLLAVSDSGCGMNQQTLAHLFEPFFTTKAEGKGTGLGLATIYGILKQNDGFINAYSEPGKGATFKIYLPRHARGSDSITDQDPPIISKGDGEVVLVVEDDAAILRLAGKMLASLSYGVLEASTPASALNLAEKHEGAIHLLMTDVVMPEMNGRELADRLRAAHPGLKVLFMSGYTADVIAHRGVLEEGVHFIQKPFSTRDLALKLKGILEK
jgi:two-component system, cell cycle sensor histidine kinase and response regulator CckA